MLLQVMNVNQFWQYVQLANGMLPAKKYGYTMRRSGKYKLCYFILPAIGLMIKSMYDNLIVELIN